MDNAAIIAETPPAVREARERCRKLQHKYGQKFTPRFTVMFNRRWDHALEKDPQGSQLKYFLDEIAELTGWEF